MAGHRAGHAGPERRIEACATLNDNGLRCGVLMGPVVPYLSDSPAQLDAAVRQIAAAGAAHVTPIVLHLRSGTREWFLGWLRHGAPGAGGQVRRAVRPGLLGHAIYQARITAQVRELARKVRRRPRQPAPGPRDPLLRGDRPPRPPPATPVAQPEQLTLL